MKIVNIDVSDIIVINNIEDLDTGEATGVSSKVVIPTGNYNNIILNFDFNNSKLCEDLNMFANFKVLCGECIDVALEKIVVKDREFKYACYIPSEVLAEECEFLLGLYGFVLNEDETLKQRVSFVPIKNSVVQGTYDPDSHEGAMPTPSVFEIYFEQVKEINEQIANEYQGIIDRLNEIKDEHIEDFNQKIEPEKQNAINDINTQADEKLEEVKADIDEHFEVNGSSYRKDINSNTFRIKRLETDIFDSGEASGNSINIKDSTLAEFQEIAVDGVCKQETTQGYNLYNNEFKSNNYGITTTRENIDNGIKITINEVTPTGNSWGFYIMLKEYVDALDFADGDDVLIKYKIKTTNTSSFPYYFGTWEAGKNKTFPSSTSQKLTEWTERYLLCKYDITKTTGAFIFYSDLINAGDIFEIKDFMICKSSVDLPYEKFTGGQASPNPPYPQEIEVIEGDFEVVSCGKNLFDYTTVVPNIHGLKSNINKDGSITTTGILNGNYIAIIPMIDITDLLEDGETYTISQSIADASIYIRIRYTDISSGNINHIQCNTSSSREFKVDKSKYTYEVAVQTSTSANWGTNELTKTYKYMLCKGTDTNFEPYQETKVTFEVPEGEFFGSVSDTIKDEAKIVFNEEDGQYHKIIEKNVGKVVFDGSESGWNYVENHKYFRSSTYDFGDKKPKLFIESGYLFKQISNRFIINSRWVSFRDNVDVNGEFYPLQDTGYKLAFRNLNFDNVEDFKRDLSENNVEVYYPLEKSYTLDLGVVDMPLSYYPVTNVSSNHELQPVINVKYYRDIKNTITSMQTDIEALKQAVSTLATNQVNLLSEVDLLQEQVSESEVVE